MEKILGRRLDLQISMLSILSVLIMIILELNWIFFDTPYRFFKPHYKRVLFFHSILEAGKKLFKKVHHYNQQMYRGIYLKRLRHLGIHIVNCLCPFIEIQQTVVFSCFLSTLIMVLILNHNFVLRKDLHT